jgi:asparagine synthase (glutamine-hydrolysing)
MPGINFVQSYDPHPTLPHPAVEAGTRALHGLPWNRVDTLVQNASCSLTCHTYAGYPLFLTHTERYDLLLEGYFYTIAQTRWAGELTALADRVLAADVDADWLGRWLRQRDGDYLIWLHDKQTGRTALVNDIFGRLPVYYHHDRHGAIVSRNIRFVRAALQREAPIDRLSLAHFMLLGHALGDKSLFCGIQCLSTATMLLIDPRRRALTVHRGCTFDFGSLRHRHRGTDDNAAALCELFTSACQARAGRGSTDIVSLSGGLDSRSVAAGLARNQLAFKCATFDLPGYTSAREVRIAAQVAQRLRSPWSCVPLESLTSRQALDLLRLKSGLSPLYMGFILSFLKTLRERHGSAAVYMTGDGGDQCLPSILPPVYLPTTAGLFDAILQEHWLCGLRLGLRRTAALTGFSAGELRRTVIEELHRYPEETWAGKWMHYQFYATTKKIYFEAEDRNRCYLWSTTPFYSNAFFLHAINCPQRQKSDFALYRKFLHCLSPALGNVDYSGFHAPLGSTLFRLSHSKKKIVRARSTWTLGIKKMLGRADTFAPEAAIFDFMRKQVAGTPGMAQLLDMDGLRALLKKPEKHEKGMIYVLFNTLALLEECIGGHSALADTPDARLASPSADRRQARV